MAVKVLDRRRFVRVASIGTLPAPLIRELDASPVVCKSTDVSPLGLGILSSIDLSVDEGLKMEISGESIQLKVATKVQDSGAKQWRYGLLVVDETIDLEHRFRVLGLIYSPEKAVSRGSTQVPKKSEKRASDDRAPRFGIDWELPIDANTLGNRTIFKLYIANISRSGMLMTSFETKVGHLAVNALLDITIDPQKKYLSRPIHGFAKVVQSFAEKSTDPTKKNVSFGIVISEIFPEDKAAWDLFIRSLEKASEDDSMGNPAA